MCVVYADDIHSISNNEFEIVDEEEFSYAIEYSGYPSGKLWIPKTVCDPVINMTPPDGSKYYYFSNDNKEWTKIARLCTGYNPKDSKKYFNGVRWYRYIKEV